MEKVEELDSFTGNFADLDEISRDSSPGGVGINNKDSFILDDRLDHSSDLQEVGRLQKIIFQLETEKTCLDTKIRALTDQSNSNGENPCWRDKIKTLVGLKSAQIELDLKKKFQTKNESISGELHRLRQDLASTIEENLGLQETLQRSDESKTMYEQHIQKLANEYKVMSDTNSQSNLSKLSHKIPKSYLGTEPIVGIQKQLL
jgi:hypothetical protein